MKALVVSESDGQLSCQIQDVEPVAVHESDVLVRIEFSSLNFKDAMVASVPSRVRQVSSLVGGVDAAGVVEASSSSEFSPGDRVAVHGGSLGVGRDGGFASFVYAPPATLSRLPSTISTYDAMVVGTAGFTSMASVLALEDRGLDAGARILVTGASGGVGSQAVTYLALHGYEVVASTGSNESVDWLLALGATTVIGRDDVSDRPGRVLGRERWDGAVDCVGGETLAQVLRSLRYGAAVAASGLVASGELSTTIYPFITRGVALLGIDAVEARPSARERVWRTLGEVAPRVDFSTLIDREVTLEGVRDALEDLRRGRTRGRVVVAIDSAPKKAT